MDSKYGIGLMSGSSLDGIDLAYVKFECINDNYHYKLIHADCYSYDEEWIEFFRNFKRYSSIEVFEKDQALGRYLATTILKFIEKHSIHQVDFIANHGHTLYHNPHNFTTVQIGNGAQIAALTSITTIDQLRLKDVALGGQGAPIVPIMDLYLLQDYKYCLNLGGIANITIKAKEQHTIAFDICAANQILNHFAQQKGLEYDKNGDIARIGNIDWEFIKTHHQESNFLQLSAPKSLDNQYSKNIIDALSQYKIEDALATACAHIGYEIKEALIKENQKEGKILITGGGAKNLFLIEIIKEQLSTLNIEVVVPEWLLVDYKEAIAMAFIGYLRYYEKPNVLHNISGAKKSSINGCVWHAN